MNAAAILIISLHALVAWILVEVFVNKAHTLSRMVYVFLHYTTILVVFGIVFAGLHYLFGSTSVFETTLVGVGSVLFYELVVFRYLYIGERWFLNWVDWIFPMFLAASAMYMAGLTVSFL